MFVHNIYGAPREYMRAAARREETGFINLHISPIVNVYFNIHLFIIFRFEMRAAASAHLE